MKDLVSWMVLFCAIATPDGLIEVIRNDSVNWFGL